MAKVTIELDPQSYRKLVECSVRELRPISWEAEILLRRALDLPFPAPDAPAADSAAGECAK